MTRMLHRIAAPLRMLAPLALAALQLACAALPAPPPSYAPTDTAPRPGGAYCNALESAASARSTAHVWSGLGVLAAGAAATVGGVVHATGDVRVVSGSDQEASGLPSGVPGMLIMGAGLATAAVGVTLLWFAQDAGALENAAARGAALPDDRKAYERCVRAYDGDVGLD